EGRYPRARVYGRSRRGRERGQEIEGRRPCGGRIPDFLRRLLLLSAGDVFALREFEPERLDGRETVRPFSGGNLRLLAPDRRVRRRTGRIRARAVRRRGRLQDREWVGGRTGPVSFRHLSHRV